MKMESDAAAPLDRFRVKWKSVIRSDDDSQLRSASERTLLTRLLTSFDLNAI